MAKMKKNAKLTPRGTRILTIEVHPEVAADLAVHAKAMDLSMSKAAHKILADYFSIDTRTGLTPEE